MSALFAPSPPHSLASVPSVDSLDQLHLPLLFETTLLEMTYRSSPAMLRLLKLTARLPFGLAQLLSQ